MVPSILLTIIPMKSRNCWGSPGIDSADISEQGWSVVELGPIRHALGQKGIDALSKELKFTLMGYDYLVTTRGARAATPLEN